MNYQTLAVSLADGVANVVLNRPDKSNAMNRQMWDDIRDVFRKLDETPEARVVVLSGAGKHFNAGIDLAMLSQITEADGGRAAHQREELRRVILDLQDVITSLETCRKPVLAAIHGACIGAGVDLTCAADMRYCSADANFVVKEIELGFVADVGTLQRLPKLIGDGMARELAYTGRPFSGAEAKAIGFVNRCYGSRDDLMAGVAGIARSIAAKSPLAIRGTKEMLIYTRDHSVAESLNYMAIWNAALLQIGRSERGVRRLYGEAAAEIQRLTAGLRLGPSVRSRTEGVAVPTAIHRAARAFRGHPAIGYVVAFVSVGLATALQWSASDFYQGAPFLTIYPAVVITAFVGGYPAGLLSAVLGRPVAMVFLHPAIPLARGSILRGRRRRLRAVDRIRQPRSGKRDRGRAA